VEEITKPNMVVNGMKNISEIIRTNSSGLVIYNPKNLAERIKGMKNTEKTREQKIAERVAYMQQQQTNSDNLN
jgi:hypothetical protein